MTNARQAIEADRFDHMEFDTTAKGLRALGRAAEQLSDVHWTGRALLRDVWNVLNQGVPRPKEVDPAFALNRQIVNQLLESDHVQDMRQDTVGDAFLSGVSTAAMERRLAELYGQLQSLQEEADEAQRKLDEAREQEPGESAWEEAEAARAALDEKLKGAIPRIGKAVRAAVQDSTDKVEAEVNALDGWGFNKGEVAKLDVAQREEFSQLLHDPTIRRIAEQLGRLRNEVFGARQVQMEQIPEEVHDIISGDDLERLLPVELAALAIEELFDDFLLRYTQSQLLTYDLRGTDLAAKGSIIFLEDSSGSMWHPDQRHVWAKAVGLKLLELARDEGRGFTAVVFGSVGQAKVFDFPEPADFTPGKVLEYATFAFRSSDTDFETPLTAALELMAAQHANKGRTEADVILATDGLCSVHPEWLANFEAERERLGFHVYGLMLDMSFRGAAVMDQLCDQGSATVHSLTTGNDVQHIFKALMDSTRTSS